MTSASIDELAGHHIVLCNWRDLDHPRAGGAEVYIERIGRRLAEGGARVTLLTSRPKGLPRRQHREGVDIVRMGSALGVYPFVFLWLWWHRRSITAVVDCQNGIPFFAPLATGRSVPVVLVFHHVHQEQFSLYLPKPLTFVARFLEGTLTRRVYGERPAVAVSPSTRAEVRTRLRLRGPIHVVPNGTDRTVAAAATRSAAPRIVCVGRLVPHKRLDLLLDAAERLVGDWPDLTVDIVGTGSAEDELRRAAADRGVAEVVRFHGWVSEEDKVRLVAESWLSVNPSQGEGWGLGVIEANELGVPSVAVAVPGLSDSIVDGVTGWLARDVDDLVTTIDRALRVLQSPARADELAAACRTWAATFDWDSSTERLAALLLAERDRVQHVTNDCDRHLTDLVVVAEFDSADPDLLARLAGLRRTDVQVRADGSARALLVGCDESRAAHALARIGAMPVTLRLARPRDLLSAGRDIA